MPPKSVEVFSDLSVTVSPELVLKHLSSRRRRLAPPSVIALAERASAQGAPLLSPLALARELPREEIRGLTFAGNLKALADALRLDGQTVLGVVAVVCTVGEAIDREIGRCFARGETSIGLGLDAVGTAASSLLTGRVHQLLRRRMKESRRRLGGRRMPGVGAVSLSLQRDIVALLGAEEFGVRVNESWMLRPKKTLTFLAPFIPKGPAEKEKG
ncbi:MAG: hypothetical protein QGG90_03015 [Nitrospinota bacterium]|jgi:hypothetical protein|nr:hypothetical protein [Nitrospinota bacterium]MDP6618391.1 hypothetical protein [Nitrospinota bacterium]MDP7386334.1 hypothetical protein [Nitrospinota bacterium]